MKNYSIAFAWVLGLFSFANSHAQLTFETPFPQPTQNISFSYKPQAHLKNAAHIEAYAFLSEGNPEEPTLQTIALQKQGEVWKGQIATQSQTRAVMLAFFEPNQTQPENNQGKGYTQILYDNQNKPLPKAYAGLSIIADFVRYLEIDKAQKNEWMRQEFKLFPDNKLRYFPTYVDVMLDKNTQKALNELKKLEKKSNMDEYEMLNVYYTYARAKNEAKMQDWEQKIIAQYPQGKLAENLKINAFYSESDTEKQLAILREFVQQFPQSARKHEFEGQLYWAEVKKLAQNKDVATLQTLLTRIATQAQAPTQEQLARNANNYAWNLAEKSENLEIANLLSKFTVEALQKALRTPQAEGIAIPAIKAQNLKGELAMYLDTYGWVLYKQEKYLDALGAFREAIATTEYNQTDTEYLERYFLAQDKTEQMLLENLVKARKAQDKHKARLRKLYIKEKQSETGFEQYIADLESEGKRKARELVMKRLINQPAPNFEIQDWAGKTVSLKSLKGKIVIVDFWATWCGPCLASFPSMQAVVDYYKNNNEIIFLFIATLDEEENVKKWAEKNKNKYSFYILYDKENRISQSFGVNGIPHKFIIDKQGQIRFSLLGFDGKSPEATRQDMEMMIETIQKP